MLTLFKQKLPNLDTRPPENSESNKNTIEDLLIKIATIRRRWIMLKIRYTDPDSSINKMEFPTSDAIVKKIEDLIKKAQNLQGNFDGTLAQEVLDESIAITRSFRNLVIKKRLGTLNGSEESIIEKIRGIISRYESNIDEDNSSLLSRIINGFKRV